MAPAQALHRHQSSLEGFIDFSTRQALESTADRFRKLMLHFDYSDIDNNVYDRLELIQSTYNYARSKESQSRFLDAFFERVYIPDGIWDDFDRCNVDQEVQMLVSIFAFADYLFRDFYLPLKWFTRKAPKLSAVSTSALERAQKGNGKSEEDEEDEEASSPAATLTRASALRQACLVRDRYRCVITRRPYTAQVCDHPKGKTGRKAAAATKGKRRSLGKRKQKKNEKKNELKNEQKKEEDEEGRYIVSNLEMAYILPIAMAQTNQTQHPNFAKPASRAILDMLDTEAAHLIEGVEIDRPHNAIMLTRSTRRLFGEFRIIFDSIKDRPHTYHIYTFPPSAVKKHFSVTRTFYLSESRTIDPPSRRLLELHNAIAHILSLSGAGKCIDKILREWERSDTQILDCVDLDHYAKRQLAGWKILIV